MVQVDRRRGSAVAAGGAGAVLLASIGAGFLASPGSASAQAGSYAGSCRNSTTVGGRLSSECRQPDGQYRRSSIEVGKCHGDIGNQNGVLVCNGATAQDGGIVSSAPPGRGDANAGRGRDDRGGGHGDDSRRSDDRGHGDRRDDRSRDDRGHDDRGRDDRGRDDRGHDDRGHDDRGHDDRGGYGRRPSDLVLFAGANFSGRRFEVHGDVSDLKRSGFNDRAHSVRVYSGRWKLCRESDYRRCEHVTRDVPDLNRLGAGGAVSSIGRE